MRDTVRHAWGRIVLYGIAGLLCVFLPMVVYAMDLPNAYYTDYHWREIMEIFGCFAAFALLGIGAFELHRRRKDDWRRKAPLLAFLLVASAHLSLQVGLFSKSNDYMDYEYAFQAVAENANPYARQYYLYPPAMAQAGAAVHDTIVWAGRWIPNSLSRDEPWLGVFYLYQVAQFLAVLLCFGLCLRLFDRLGVGHLTSAILLACVFLINEPLLRNITRNQVNVILLDLILLGVLLADRWPVVAGLATSMGIHLKIYPILLLGVFGLKRYWRALGAGGAGVLLILAIQTGFFQDMQLYRDFWPTLGHLTHRGQCFRDNSLHSLVRNTFRLVSLVRGTPIGEYSVYIRSSFLALVAITSIWFLYRYRQRQVLGRHEMANRALGGSAFPHGLGPLADLVDTTMLMLLISPNVWEHHYVLAMPGILWAFATVGRVRPIGVAVGAFLILGIPTFDFFPLSYNRIAGLLLLFWLTSPRRMARLATDQENDRQPDVSGG